MSEHNSQRPTVLFDRDGTLLDFYDMFHRFILDLHRTQGVIPPSRSEIVSYEYWQSIISGGLRIGEILVRDRVSEVHHRYMSYGRLFPGVARAVRALASADVRLGLVSSGPGTAATAEFLARSGIRDVFGVLVTRDDLPTHLAEVDDAECKVVLAREALTDLGHDTSDPVFVIGDSPADVDLGRALGARVIGVRTGNGARLLNGARSAPDVVVDSAAEVTSVVLGGDAHATGALGDGDPAHRNADDRTMIDAEKR